jgi:Immunoglobulin domain
MKAILYIILVLFGASLSYASQSTVAIGQAVTIGLSSVQGTPPFTYQWKKGGVDIAGATAATYVIASVQVSDSGNYTVMVKNSAGETISDWAVLTVTPPPVIIPSKATTIITLSVPPPLPTGTAKYQWLRNGRTIWGANKADLVVTDTRPARYSCLISYQ